MPQRESVFFYTLHKCASSLFGDFVLKAARGLEHVDYAAMLFSGAPVDRVAFEETGHLYGPIRASAVPETRVHRELVTPTVEPSFVRDRIALVLVRDPRDLLVSGYYSFGFTHPWSPVPELRAVQEARRADISAKSIDEYALDEAATTLGHFATLARVLDACRRATLLRYEDMLEEWPRFERGLTSVLEYSEDDLAELRRRATPPETEDPTAHRRQGRPGDHRRKLRPETIARLDRILAPTLAAFGYAATPNPEP